MMNRAGVKISRAHLQGAVVGAVLAGMLIGGMARSSWSVQAQDLHWLGRRLMEKRRLVEHQRVAFARLVADVERAVESLEGAADHLGTATARASHDDAEYEINTVAASDDFLTPRADVAAVVARLEAVEDRVATLSETAAFVRAVGQSGLEAEADVPTAWPVGGRVTSGFGMRVAPIRGGWRMHPGLDISAASGTRVRSAGAGLVVFSGYRSGYGKTIVIDHGDGMKTLYGHMSRVATSEGRRVAEGDVIGFVGSTGRSTGPHLHFEIRFRGEPVNPMCYLAGRPRMDASALTTPG